MNKIFLISVFSILTLNVMGQEKIVQDVFRLTLYKSKPNKLLIFNGVIKIKRLGRVYPRVRIRSLSSGRFFKSGFPKWLKMRLSD